MDCRAIRLLDTVNEPYMETPVLSKAVYGRWRKVRCIIHCLLSFFSSHSHRNVTSFASVLGGLPSFVSPRPANHRAIPALAEALSKDIFYALPENYMRGAGDTYFSGKMLAKLGRIIVIAQELRGLAETPDYDMPDTSTANGKELFEIIQSCRNEALPTEEEVMNAIERLKQGVEVWLNGTSLAPLTYDNSWGGMVSCGCWFNGQGCDNSYPNCPSYTGGVLRLISL